MHEPAAGILVSDSCGELFGSGYSEERMAPGMGSGGLVLFHAAAEAPVARALLGIVLRCRLAPFSRLEPRSRDPVDPRMVPIRGLLSTFNSGYRYFSDSRERLPPADSGDRYAPAVCQRGPHRDGIAKRAFLFRPLRHTVGLGSSMAAEEQID